MRFREFLLERKELSAKIGVTFNVTIPVDSPLYDNSSDETSFEESVKKTAASLSDVLGTEVKVSKKQSARQHNNWVIQPGDGSTSWAHAIQILSPLDELNVSLKNSEAVAKWMDSNGLKTTDSDVAMVAINLTGIEEHLDPVKLVLFLDDSVQLPITKYTTPQIEIILHKIKTTGKLPESANDLIKFAEKYLGKRDEGQTNFDNLSDGVIEFKVASGAGYEHDIEFIKKKIQKLTTAVEIAADATKNRGEYIQKLMLQFNAKEPSLPVTGKNNKLPQELKRLYLYDPEILSGWKLYSTEAEHGSPRTQLLILINTAMKAVKNQNSSLTSDEKLFFKKLIKQTALQEHDVDEYYDHDHITRLKFKTDFGV